MRTPEASHLKLIVGERKLAPSISPQATLDDTQLLAALKSGDPSAARALYDRTFHVVQRTVRRLLNQRDMDVEDLCQHSFIELVNTIDRFRGDCPLDAWVSVLSARVVYKHLRRRKLERRFFSSTPLHVVTEVPSAARHGAVLLDLVHRVRAHLTRIDDNRAFTFLLHDAYGYDLNEIAQITGVSVAAAQSRLVRGRREVHERIASDPSLARALDGLSGPGET